MYIFDKKYVCSVGTQGIWIMEDGIKVLVVCIWNRQQQNLLYGFGKEWKCFQYVY